MAYVGPWSCPLTTSIGPHIMAEIWFFSDASMIPPLPTSVFFSLLHLGFQRPLILSWFPWPGRTSQRVSCPFTSPSIASFSTLAERPLLPIKDISYIQPGVIWARPAPNSSVNTCRGPRAEVQAPVCTDSALKCRWDQALLFLSAALSL